MRTAMAAAEPAPITVHVVLAEAGFQCFGAWCFKPGVLEAQRGKLPPVRYCTSDLLAYLRHLPPGREITYSDHARTLLEAEGKEVVT